MLENELGIDIDSDFAKSRRDNLERICELVYDNNKEMFEEVNKYFNRSMSEYYMERELYPKNEQIIQLAYIQTLGYISKLNENENKKTKKRFR